MFTEESSQQLTPLGDERITPSEPVHGLELQPPASSLEPWTPWADVAKGIAVWISSVAFLIFVPVAVAFPYVIYRALSVGLEGIATDKALFFLSVVGVFPTHLLTFVTVWMVVTEGGRYPFWKTVGFEWPRGGPLLVTLLSFMLAVILLVLAWAATSLFGGAKTDLDVLIESSMYARVATALIAVLGAPLIEELIYRGVLYPALERAAGVGVAIAIVSLLFAGVHVVQYRNNIAVIAVITILSITLTVARAVSGKLLPSFIIHLVFNGIQSIVLVLAPFVDRGVLDKGDQAAPTATPGFELTCHLFDKVSILFAGFHIF